MDKKQILRLAECAKERIDRAISELKNPALPMGDPDFDLWSAYCILKKLDRDSRRK